MTKPISEAEAIRDTYTLIGIAIFGITVTMVGAILIHLSHSTLGQSLGYFLLACGGVIVCGISTLLVWDFHEDQKGKKESFNVAPRSEFGYPSLLVAQVGKGTSNSLESASGDSA